MEKKIKRCQHDYDVLVVGAGLAGLKAAITCSEKGKNVLLITASILCSGSSFYPLMDSLHCLCTSSDDDKENFFQDIESISYTMNDPYMGKYYIDHIEACIWELPDMGIEYHKLPEQKLACFAKYPRDLYYWKNWNLLRNHVTDVVSGHTNITLYEHTGLLSILTEDNQTAGAVLRHEGGDLESVFAKSVILASGGLGGLYLHNLNTADVDGSTHALALKAGAQLINMEFNQFIPGFLSPAYKTIFREGSLRHCTGLYDTAGSDILAQMLPDADDYRKCLTLREPHGPFTTVDSSKYFDIALMKAAISNIRAAKGVVDETVGTVIRYAESILDDDRGYVRDYIDWLRKEHHVDIEKDTISIVPFFHAANGGIYVDHHCSTSVEGLFSCGEAAGGIHGADRMGGMASGSCLVFGKLAANSACEFADSVAMIRLDEEDVKRQLLQTYVPFGNVAGDADPRDKDDGCKDNGMDFDTACRRIKTLMWEYANVIRTEDGLTYALQEIDGIAAWLKQIPVTLELVGQREFFKAVQHVDLSRTLLAAMLARKESRGGHYREDYPDLDLKFDDRRVVVSGGRDGILVGFKQRGLEEI